MTSSLLGMNVIFSKAILRNEHVTGVSQASTKLELKCQIYYCGLMGISLDPAVSRLSVYIQLRVPITQYLRND